MARARDSGANGAGSGGKSCSPGDWRKRGARIEEGLLLVRGANRMLGYLNKPEETAAVFRDGWYVTGDIVIMDADGFIRIVDRQSRFSKIGGEMVPHGKVEEVLRGLSG